MTAPVIGTAIAAGAVVTAMPVWLSGALETTPEALVSFAAQIVGGATPGEAAFVQVLVLVGLLVAECVSAVVTARGLGPFLGAHRPKDAATV